MPAVALPLSVGGNLPKQNEYFQFQLHHDQKYAMFPCRAGDRGNAHLSEQERESYVG
ncbi:Uncharacterised protein [Shigella sonnei]|nr:Uncharacterised protein [Shigella sonnei]CSP27937.1 Uncharacterised protein [Shigella sonnei]